MNTGRHWIVVVALLHGARALDAADVRDSSAAANHGVSVGMVAADLVTGVADGALRFDGVGKYVETAAYDGLDTLQAGTVSAWVKTTTNGTVLAYCGVEDNGGVWALSVNSGRMRVGAKIPNSHWIFIDGARMVADGAWHHIAATADGVNAVKLHVDGAADSTTVTRTGGTEGDASDWWADAYLIGSVTNHIDIGGLRRSSLGGVFSGSLDEVRVSDVPRSSNWLWACWMNVASNEAFSGSSPVYSAASVDAAGIPDVWKIRYFGSTNAPDAQDADDWDHDGLNNYGEWRAGTDPTNAASRLGVEGFGVQGEGEDVVMRWSSVSGKSYAVDCGTNLLEGFPVTVGAGILATPDVNTRTVRVERARQQFFRVRVEE